MELSDIVDKISDNYTSDAIEFTNSAVDGYWAIPYTTEVQGWAFNTEILDKYNLDVPRRLTNF
jgi:ABC-type glycerol-3-phosphate transport system substrate-binding protein